MKCQDVRRTLPLFVDGQLALTEWAIIQGHLLECAECRKEVERLRAVASVRARATHLRATAMAVAAMAMILVVAVLGGYFIYEGRFPDVPSWSTVAPPWTATPTAPVPGPVEPAPAPVARPSPPPPA
ncbi:MAG TPA: zf-HC2 domain-containing protein, partial [Methylomirabilota bacterium]|nr:zf-HC2 domain-containing protein [Methylomirabilota bacterium]